MNVFQCAIVQELRLRTHSCSLLQYAELLLLRFRQLLWCLFVNEILETGTNYILPKSRENCVIVHDLK